MLRVIATLTLAATTLAAADSESAKRLINLNVIATDAKGEPVTDLKSTDVRIKEDGKQRPIYFFHFDGYRRETAAPARDQSANHPGPPTTVILFDRWNETAITNASAWGDLDRLLDHMETAQRIYIYFLTARGDLYVVHGIPPAGSDRELEAPFTPAQLKAALDEAVKKLAALRPPDVLDPLIRTNTTLKALAAVGSFMAPIGGRKDLVWVTHGFPLVFMPTGDNGGRGRQNSAAAATNAADMLDFTPQVRNLSTLANQSEISIYTVDESKNGAGADPTGEGRQTLQTLSSLTGGRWYPSGEIEDALNGISADARATYHVSFYSEVRPKDKKEHKLRLESDRKGIRLLTEEGFFADAPEPPAADIERTLINAAARSPFDATEIGLRGQLDQGRLTLRIEPADIFLDHAGNQYTGHLGVSIASYAGDTLGNLTQPVEMNIRLGEDEYNKALKDGLSVNQNLTLNDTVHQIRAIVYDQNLRSLGSLTIPVK
jgi:VWFA-related protein